MSLKALIEKRGQLAAEMNGILAGMKNEERAANDEESARFEAIEKEIAGIDRSLEIEKRAQRITEGAGTVCDEPSAVGKIPETEQEVRAAKDIVSDFIRGNELRAGEMTTTSTGNIIPSEFSQDIISKVTELCGILNRVAVVNSKGTYKQIVADNDNKMTAGWTGEIEEILSSTAKFSTVEIGHHKLTALAKLSQEAINQNAFDLAAEVENQIYKDFALKAETAIIKGTGVKQPTGLVSAGTSFTLDSSAAVTSDEIVRIFHALKASYQQSAVWIMSNSTLCAVRLLTDGAGRYVFHQNENLTSGYTGTILGKPVLVSEAIDDLGAGKKPILFGDFGRAYKVNINPEMSMQILNEKYAEYGMKGILSIMWLDGRPVNEDAYVTVSCPAAVPATTGGGSDNTNETE